MVKELLNMWPQLLCIALAGVFKAVADTIAHHYSTSVFNGKDFFNPEIQGKRLPFTKYPLDGWHVANSCMIFCFCVGAVGVTWKVLAAGFIFIIVFNLFYNTILKSK